MATPVLKVITEYCTSYVNDLNLQTLAQEDAPLYARRMWGYFRAAIPHFTSPPTMQEYLLGDETTPKFTEPKVATYSYINTSAISAETTINLGESYIGFELFACRLQTYDDFGNKILTPTDIVAYDAENGAITITPTVLDGEITPIPAGAIFDMDFYADGEFSNTLTPEMMKILGMCFQVVWLEHFTTDYISLVPKVYGGEFKEQNIANKERADTEKVDAARRRLAEEMRKFESKKAYVAAVPSAYRYI